MSVYQKGLGGEQQAEAYLHAKGYETLCRRWRAADGEIDLVMRDGTCLVFVEVKSRPQGRMGDGMLAVTPAKRRRMAHAALAFLVQREYLGCAARFDVVEMTRDGLRHVQDAFRLGE
ncbi:MAG: YraN family protein [Aristaeellaceae bacterium]